jgi:hypothetical protein
MNTVKQMISLFIVIGACLGIVAFVLALTSKQNCDTKERYESSDCNGADNIIKDSLNRFCRYVCKIPDVLPSPPAPPVTSFKAMCTSSCKKYDKLCQQFCNTVAHDRSGGRGKSWAWDLDCYVNDKTNNDICGDDTDCRKNGGEPHMVSATAPVSLSVDSKSSNKHHSLAPGIIVLIIIAALVMLLTIRQMIINYAKA